LIQIHTFTDFLLALSTLVHPTTRIWLDGLHAVADAGVCALADDCPQLTKISLDGCVHVTSTGVRALAEKCSGMVDISLKGCVGLTDGGVVALATHCKGELTAPSTKIYSDLYNH
jgi:hypothetical protein